MPELVIRPLESHAEAEACARMMAETEPWLTLGRDYAACLRILLDETRERYVALRDGELAGLLLLNLDASKLTGRFQASSANRVTFCGSRWFENENVRDDGIEIVPFVAFRDLLFFDENRPPYALNLQAVVLPRGESHDVIQGSSCRHFGEQQWQAYVKRCRLRVRLRGPAWPRDRCTSPEPGP